MNHKMLTAAGLTLAALLVQPATAETVLGAQECGQGCGQGQEASTQGRGELRQKRALGRQTQRTRAQKRIVHDERARFEQDPERKKKAKKKGERRKKKGDRKKKGKKKRIGRRGTPPEGGRPPQGTPPQGGGQE